MVCGFVRLNGKYFVFCARITQTYQCFHQPAAKQGTMTTDKSEKVGPTSLATDHRDLLLTANKVFGEGKWNHTVISQTLGTFATLVDKILVSVNRNVSDP